MGAWKSREDGLDSRRGRIVVNGKRCLPLVAIPKPRLNGDKLRLYCSTTASSMADLFERSLAFPNASVVSLLYVLPAWGTRASAFFGRDTVSCHRPAPIYRNPPCPPSPSSASSIPSSPYVSPLRPTPSRLPRLQRAQWNRTAQRKDRGRTIAAAGTSRSFASREGRACAA
ncbi:hypothetical protein B0H12DRAFT_373245 [Mycena haematopus]|nr:hypothetical protein B0H12DRAFT_373245 [Mycena haematopus]